MVGTDETGTAALVAGRYRLGDAIGRGGMATVYRAWDVKLERRVAVKVFAAAEAHGDAAARRLREVRLLAGANHPHLVTLFDSELPVLPDGGPALLVMELVDGEPLRRRLDSGGADPELARAVALELSGALAYLHARGIVHRDLKPENVLVDGSTRSLKLVDFGIAQLVGSERLTVDGTILGTAAYLSPEQVAGREVGPAADVYALGLVVLECLTGRRAFPGPAVEAAVARMSHDPGIPPGIAPQWRDLLAAMTARDPADRPHASEVERRVSAAPGIRAESAFEFTTAAMAPFELGLAEAATLPYPDTAALDGHAMAAPDAAGVVSNPRRRRRRGGVLLAAAALLLAGAGIALAIDPLLDAATRHTAQPTPVPTVSVTVVPQLDRQQLAGSAPQPAASAAPQAPGPGAQTAAHGRSPAQPSSAGAAHGKGHGHGTSGDGGGR